MPDVRGISPEIIISNVLLPQPLGPTIETNWPAGILTLTPSSA